ncbi:MAG: tRNA pseudouridine(55) synthase TruB [Bacteroidales bacterium OttesenSCG-928-I14]|jgi:tRNA pseudouridine55 synthase|nr:tRNA pseudouridine(55) synthase TruB [Bacteroidales bacterium OttesenSCG-928-I14]
MNFQSGKIIYVEKPLYWTSFYLTNTIKHTILQFLNIKKIKIGHAGTLDPLATGVMIICTGNATKRIEEFQHKIKEYIATIRIGITTPSFDLETPINCIYKTSHITKRLVEKILPQFLGNIEQIPPSFSACKINGNKAYELARKNKKVELKPKSVIINKIELLVYYKEEIKIRVICGKGTYIRALARDIGIALQSGACLSNLIRTRIGDIGISDCLKIHSLSNMFELNNP